MRCAKCGHKIRGATWYCPSCGTPVDDLNVADSVYASGWSRLWVRILSAAVALFALAGVVFLTGRVLRGVDLARRTARPTAAAALPAAPSAADAGATINGPIETLVAAGERSAGLYPDGAVDAPPGVATALPTGEPTVVAPAGVPTQLAAPSTDVPARATPPPTAPARPDAPVWAIPRIGSTLQMDGWVDDWPTAPLSIADVVFGRGAWSGADDLSATARMAWDEQMLYLGVEVTDDVFSQGASGRDLHMGDGVELQLDTDLAGDFDSEAMSADDWQIGISPGDLAGRAPEVYAWRPRSGPMSGVRLGARATDTGYVLEAALPWAAIDVNPQAIDTIGASLNVTDNDTGERAQQTMIASSARRAWGDPRTWGTWVLGR